MIDELVLEQVTSESLQLIGVYAQVADMIGEAYGMGNVIESIIRSVQSGTAHMASVKQTADRYAFTRQDSSASHQAASIQVIDRL
jgi:hypothetical protein